MSVTGITLSAEQGKLAVETCKGLPINIVVGDYRSLSGQFDRIMSIGMLEHVGYKNYQTFFHIAHDCLLSDGLFLLHTIGRNSSCSITDPWIEKYIFPNSMIPSAAQITRALENLFVIEDWHNFGADYDHTLMCWQRNFVRNWHQISSCFDKKIYRMWN